MLHGINSLKNFIASVLKVKIIEIKKRIKNFLKEISYSPFADYFLWKILNYEIFNIRNFENKWKIRLKFKT